MKIILGFEPTGKDAVVVHSKVECKKPEPGRMPTTFFATPNDTLLRDDPSQPKLPLRAVADDRGSDLREAQ